MPKTNKSIQFIALDFIEHKNNNTFKTLINRLKPGLLSFTYKYLRDKELANEAVSQTFVAIWKKIDQYNSNYNFSTWVYAIAKNEALGILRNANKTVSYDMYLENHSKTLQIHTPVYNINTEVIGPSGEELTKLLCDASISIINELDEPYKKVMIEREINQKQLHVIALDLQWNLSTVKTRLRKARKDVAEKLYNKYPTMVDLYFHEKHNIQ